jgi:hypothetical protein
LLGDHLPDLAGAKTRRLRCAGVGYVSVMNPFRTWRIRRLDVVVALWTCVWIVLGVLVGRDLHQLTQLSATVATSGRAMRAVVDTVTPLRSLPVVGSSIAPLAKTAASEAASVQASGRVSAQSVRQLSILLGLAVVVAPTVPLLVLYAPLRISQEREARAFRRTLANGADDSAFEEFLAQRAVQNLPYHRLREITANPWHDIREGNFGALADAELRRVGVRRPNPAPRRRHLRIPDRS